MSIIYITDHNEVIYDVIKTRQKIIPKSPRYESYLNQENVRKEKIGKQGHATMGLAEYPRPNPCNFLRKKPKTPFKGKSKRQCLTKEKRNPLPSTKGAKIKKEETTNFIEKNINEVKNLKPPEITAKFVDTRDGQVQLVDNSGLDPKYIHSKGFGKLPKYLLRRVANTRKLEQIGKDKNALKTLPKCRYVTRQERDNLLNGLKKNWEIMQKEYQLLPMITDTIPKILRKTKMEKDLNELEKDILLIEKHPFIYILDEDE